MDTGYLPTTSTSFVGQTDELERNAALINDPACRLLTLLGAGGIGKTRLAIQAAEQQVSLFSDGLYFVALTGVRSSELINSAITSALSVSFYSTEDLRMQIIRYLREKQILLITDNFEHLLDGTELLSEIMRAAPRVKFLVTSRERLNVQEEWVLALEGLAFPEEPASALLESYSAVQLFVQRARQVEAKFSIRENAAAVKLICQQVEGMPLGLELAATWLQIMSCHQIAVQLEHGVDFLTTPLRNVPERHRSVRIVFEQSWELLSAPERDVLMRLSIFRGGFDREAAEQVAGATLAFLAGLADRSLIRLSPSGRYDLQELLRQFAAGKLNKTGEASGTAQQHLDYFMKLVEQAEAHCQDRDWHARCDRLEIELDNLRAALAWSVQGGEAELGLRLATAIGSLPEWTNRRVELLAWLERLLALAPDVPPLLRANALNRAAETASFVGNDLQVRMFSEKALALAREAGDKSTIAWALAQLGFFAEPRRDLSHAAALLEESLALFRELEDPLRISHLRRRRASIAYDQEDYQLAQLLFEEELAWARQLEDRGFLTCPLDMLGNIAWKQDRNYRKATTLLQEALALSRETGDTICVALVLIDIATLGQAVADYKRAEALYQEALMLFCQVGHHNYVQATVALVGLGSLTCMLGKPERAARLFGAVEASVREGYRPDSPELALFESDLASARTQLGEAAFSEAWTIGKAMTREEVLAYALQRVTLPLDKTQAYQDIHLLRSDHLTARELELLRLIAEGCSNREISNRLYIGVSTVKKHINHLYDKLGAKNRTQAVARAREQRILG